MNHVVLVKHSLPEIRENVPAREWNLSENGKARASTLAEALRKYQCEAIYSSIEPKALQTANILGDELVLNVQVVDGLHEHDRSRSPFYSKSEFESLVRRFFAQPDDLIFGSETAYQTLVRFRSALEPLLTFKNDENKIVVCHGAVISLYASWLTDCDGFQLWQELGLPSFVALDVKSKSIVEKQNIN